MRRTFYRYNHLINLGKSSVFIAWLAFILVSCSTGSQETTSSNDTMASTGLINSPPNISFEMLINFMEKNVLLLSYSYCARLGIEPQQDGFKGIMEVVPVDSSNYLLAHKDILGCYDMECQQMITLLEFNRETVINKHSFDVQYQTEPHYSLQHGTFF